MYSIQKNDGDVESSFFDSINKAAKYAKETNKVLCGMFRSPEIHVEDGYKKENKDILKALQWN